MNNYEISENVKARRRTSLIYYYRFDVQHMNVVTSWWSMIAMMVKNSIIAGMVRSD